MTDTKSLQELPKFENASDSILEEIREMPEKLSGAMFTSPHSQYPESKFRRYFAPYFLGLYDPPANVNMMMLWVGEVGSYHLEVDIIDDNTGEILFSVPPIFNTDGLNINVNAQANIRFKGLEQVFNAEAMNNPQGAVVRFYNGISQKLNSLFNGYSADPNVMDKWLKIFEFYKVTPPVPENVRIIERANPSNASKASNADNSWGDLQLDFNPGI